MTRITQDQIKAWGNPYKGIATSPLKDYNKIFTYHSLYVDLLNRAIKIKNVKDADHAKRVISTHMEHTYISILYTTELDISIKSPCLGIMSTHSQKITEVNNKFTAFINYYQKLLFDCLRDLCEQHVRDFQGTISNDILMYSGQGAGSLLRFILPYYFENVQMCAWDTVYANEKHTEKIILIKRDKTWHDIDIPDIMDEYNNWIYMNED